MCLLVSSIVFPFVNIVVDEGYDVSGEPALKQI